MKAKRPNLLFIFADHHRRFDLGCYGNPQVLTPQLDAAFFRTHRAFIVNLRFVRRATKTQVFLKDGTQVPLARGLFDALARALIAYF